MMRRFSYSLVVALVLGLGAAESAMAQSVLVTRGLGLPVEPLDARSRGLGGVGIGLPDGEISWLSPGGLFGLPAPAMVAAYQYDQYSTTSAGADFNGNTARMPFLLGAFPAGPRAVIFAGFGSFLDQNWRIESRDTLIVAGDSVPVLDLSTSTGGVARLRVGGTYQIVDGLGLGVGLDVFTGRVDRVQGRAFGGELTPACCLSSWRYDGVGYTFGAHWAPTAATGLAISASYGGTLKASPASAEALAKEYELPLLLRGGLSGRIGQNTLLAVSGDWDGWSSLSDAVASEGGARDSWSVHSGLEWDAATLKGRPLPFRIGARTGALPFRWDAGAGAEAGWANERAATAGLGLVMGGGAVRTDLSIEAGKRGGDSSGFDESFWRFGFSARILGR